MSKKRALLGIQTEPIEYVIHTPDHDDFLSLFESREGVTATGWDPHPEKAIRFKTYGDAERVAQKIAINQTDPQNTRYTILVCTLRDLGRQYEVKSVREIFAYRIPDVPTGGEPN